MIPRFNRFFGHSSIGRVYRGGQTSKGPLFSLRYKHDPQVKNYRLAVVVSKKVAKSAVVRNRIRRRLYEAVRTIEPQPSRDTELIITVFSARVADMPYKQLQDQLHQQLQRANLLTDNK